MSHQNRTVLVIGASRGLGLALAQEWLGRGWHVIATERAPSHGLRQLQHDVGERLEIEQVDIARAAQVRGLRERMAGRSLDVLFINAGVARAVPLTPATADEDDFTEMMLVNALAPVRVAEILGDRVRRGGADASLSVEQSIPLVVDMVQAHLGVPGLRFVDRFNQTIAW